MDKVKVLIVEDELIIAEDICDTLKDFGYETLEPAINYTEAIYQIEKNKPDIAILDIYLSGKKTGIDIAKKIRENYNLPFIFLTSNSDPLTIEKSKEVLPSAYLIKPFSKNELYASIEIALHNFSKKIGTINSENLVIKNSLFVKEKGSYSKVNFKDILYLKSCHVYVEIFLRNEKKMLIRSSLNDILENLDSRFIRVHRSYILNSEYLSKISQTSINLLDYKIPIGRKYKEDIIRKINIV